MTGENNNTLATENMMILLRLAKENFLKINNNTPIMMKHGIADAK